LINLQGEKILSDFNQSTLDPVGPVDQRIAVLKEMNDLEARRDEFVKRLAPRVDVL
jgi:hypothetical protein